MYRVEDVPIDVVRIVQNLRLWPFRQEEEVEEQRFCIQPLHVVAGDDARRVRRFAARLCPALIVFGALVMIRQIMWIACFGMQADLIVPQPNFFATNQRLQPRHMVHIRQRQVRPLHPLLTGDVAAQHHRLHHRLTVLPCQHIDLRDEPRRHLAPCCLIHCQLVQPVEDQQQRLPRFTPQRKRPAGQAALTAAFNLRLQVVEIGFQMVFEPAAKAHVLQFGEGDTERCLFRRFHRKRPREG